MTLSNGETYKIGDQIKFIFECRDLDQISPATVSWLGIIKAKRLASTDNKQLSDKDLLS